MTVNFSKVIVNNTVTCTKREVSVLCVIAHRDKNVWKYNQLFTTTIITRAKGLCLFGFLGKLVCKYDDCTVKKENERIFK